MTSASPPPTLSPRNSSISHALANVAPANYTQQSAATVVTHGSRSAKCRVDNNVPLSEVIRQLVTSSQLGIKDADPALYCLREGDDLVTPENFVGKLARGARFKLVSSPALEARDMLERLRSGDSASLKLATFALRTYVKEISFVDEFIQGNGVRELTSVIQRVSGNTLAYALSSLQSLMESEDIMAALDDRVLEKLVEIVSEQSLTNIVRPATAILRNLLVTESEPPSEGTSAAAHPSFLRIWLIARGDVRFLPAVAERLGAGDKLLVQASLALWNAMIRPAIDLGVDDFLHAVATLDIQQAVLRLAEASPSTDLIPFILEYQAVLVSLCRADSQPLTQAKNSAMLLEELEMKASASLSALGVDSHDLDGSFGESGVLTSKALITFAKRKGDMAKMLADQQNGPEDRRCPIARAASEVLEELAEQLGFSTSEIIEMHDLDFLLLAWPQIFALALKMFHRFWIDSATVVPDFAKISTLVRGQIRTAVAGRVESTEAFHEVERLLIAAQYRSARDRYSKELEIEDDLLTKAPIRSLRSRLYKESFEFVRSQRIQCLEEGAWMLHWSSDRRTPATRTWRFYRLAKNHRYLHFLEQSTRHQVKAGIEDLPHRIDLNMVSDIVPHAQHAKTHHRTGSTSTQTTNDHQDSHLRFSLMCAEGMLADLQAPDDHVYAEWLDGLSMLKQDGRIQTQETANLIQTLTEIGIKVKLLDLTGERVEIPTSCAVSGVPLSEDFVYL